MTYPVEELWRKVGSHVVIADLTCLTHDLEMDRFEPLDNKVADTLTILLLPLAFNAVETK